MGDTGGAGGDGQHLGQSMHLLWLEEILRKFQPLRLVDGGAKSGWRGSRHELGSKFLPHQQAHQPGEQLQVESVLPFRGGDEKNQMGEAAVRCAPVHSAGDCYGGETGAEDSSASGVGHGDARANSSGALGLPLQQGLPKLGGVGEAALDGLERDQQLHSGRPVHRRRAQQDSLGLKKVGDTHCAHPFRPDAEKISAYLDSASRRSRRNSAEDLQPASFSARPGFFISTWSRLESISR